MSLTCGFTFQSADTAAGFSRALHAVAGDGVTPQGGGFSISVNGFTATLAPGYAYAAGQYLQSDGPYTLPIAPPKTTGDRTDVIAVRVDYKAREATLEVLADVDPAKLREDLSTIRNDGQYAILLYSVRVRRGATSLAPGDITDLRDDGALCGRLLPFSAVAGDVLYAYSFLSGGIDQEVAQAIAQGNALAAKADGAIASLDEQIINAGGGAGVGDLMTSRRPPSETGWLLCDGGPVPPAYAELSALLGGTLPGIPSASGRYKTYIFAGAPASTQ